MTTHTTIRAGIDIGTPNPDMTIEGHGGSLWRISLAAAEDRGPRPGGLCKRN
jgi:hypothetical protein